MGCDADGSVNQFAEEIKMNLGAQMMVIYIFVTTTYRKRYLKDVTLQNKELAFVFEEEKNTRGNRRCFYAFSTLVFGRTRSS